MPVNQHTLSTLAVGHTERLACEITAADVDRFTALSGDDSPVHVDDAYARSKGFPGRIAHGLLIGAHISALVGTKLPGQHGILQSCELEFRAPLVPPERIEITGEVTGISVGTGQVALKITVRNSAGKLLATGKVKSILHEPASSPTAMQPSPFRQLADQLHRRYGTFATVWEQSRAQFGEAWEQEISENIVRVFGAEPSQRWDEAVDGYAEFCTEALRAQVFFEKHGHYKASNYQEVLKECYHDADYMEKRYLPGQYLSHSIWPHHQRMLRHFTDVLLPKIAADVSLFYEVGVGCGMYSQKTLQALPQARGVGYDISDNALKLTERVVRAHGLADRYEIRNQDIIAQPIERKADFVISQEVLEHLEDPQAFIHGLFAAARPGGWAYITAAINAAHTDHIYRYRSPDEVRAQIERAGWQVQDVQIECNYPDKPVEFRPTIAGFLARKP